MKFLLALSLLASTAAFANEHGRDYKCWETAQGHRGYPTYVFEVSKYHPTKNYLQLELEYPEHIQFERKHDCWVGRGEDDMSSSEAKHGEWFKVCEGEGQNINGLIPVDIEEENFEGTVYCERGLGQVFEERDHHDDDDMLK